MKSVRTSADAELTFGIPRGRPGRLLLGRLIRLHGLREDPRRSRETVYLDTFDGRLFARSRALWSREGALHLERLDRPDEERRMSLDGLPVFAAGLPRGELRDELVTLTRDRALLRLFTVRSEVRTWSCRNRDRKTVLRVSLADDEASDGKRTAPLAPRVVVRQVRGYNKVFRQVCGWWEERGARPEGGSRYREAVEALDLDPLRAASVSRVELAASMGAAGAVRAMLGAQYRVARVNEEGVLNDVDTEFLHDFRVAVRRARSYLGQLRDVFAPEPAAKLRKRLAWLGKSTNVLRDLDVYLLQQADYRGMLTGALADDLAPLFDFAAGERKAACRELAEVMGSRAYGEALEQWRECVEDGCALGSGRRGSEPILRLAGERVAKKCRAVLQEGYRLGGGAAPDAFHSLRIECKQLRYLMEVLGDLMPEARSVVPRLKKLQDALGTIQDLTVHEARTRDFAQAASAAGDGRALPAAEDGRALPAAEVLVSRMRIQRELACAKVPELFAQFSQSLRETDPPYTLLLPWLRRLQDG